MSLLMAASRGWRLHSPIDDEAAASRDATLQQGSVCYCDPVQHAPLGGRVKVWLADDGQTLSRTQHLLRKAGVLPDLHDCSTQCSVLCCSCQASASVLTFLASRSYA